MRFLTRAACAAAICGGAAAQGDDGVRFNRDVLPILSDNCFACHGPDEKQRQADLRLDVRQDALAAEAFVPGKPGESSLVERILSGDPDVVMPPPDAHKTLTAAQKETLKRWVAEGAEYEGHWSYVPPVKVAAPDGAAAIDYFIDRKLAERGLTAAPEADRRTLARRLSLDLLGLPPTPEEVEAFAADDRPDAYSRHVERLLASPHHGERLAVVWLDVVRFADTIGYHSDTPRNVWPYRDYVIRSFNGNKPFDVFTVEQLAGDLLPGAGQEQQVASCFNRLLLSTEEGGAQPKDYEARMLGDRVRAVGAAWLGQTLGCCQCHDHKFDPTSQRDFYAMGAFFADVQEPIIGRREPGLLVTTDSQVRELARLKAAEADAQRKLDAETPALAAARGEWERTALDSVAGQAWTTVHPDEVKSDGGVTFKIEKDGGVGTSRNPQKGTDSYRISFKTPAAGVTGLRLDVLPGPGLPSKGPGRASNGNFVLSEARLAWEFADSALLTLAHASATFEQPGFPAERTIDGIVEANNGWAVMGAAGKESGIVFELAEPIAEAGKPLVLTLEQPYGTNHVIGRFRLSATTKPRPIRAAAAGVPAEIADLLKIASEKRNDGQNAKLVAHFRAVTPLLDAARKELETAKKAAADYEAALPRCLVSVSGSPRTVRLLPRGNWQDESGPVVTAALPHYLPGSELPDGRVPNRLDLANWLVSRENPLTARVFVNRLWKQFYGAGLSRTLDDLGSQGEYPSHPELLDWLAVEFMDSGWDVRHLVRLMVESRAYRRSSAIADSDSSSPQSLDPANRLLARQNRWRLDAEFVRDDALAVSGLLAAAVGGPSVRPYQPDGYWENLNFPVRSYDASTGEDQYRRGVYVWWQRSYLHPSLLAFDAPTREECAADRPRSNIPQQALVLLNDPTYVEAARVFAARIMKDGGTEDDAKLAWAFRQAVQRPPREEERRVVLDLLMKDRDRYAADPAAATVLLKVGNAPAASETDAAELAAWTTVARVLLNLHETITRS